MAERWSIPVTVIALGEPLSVKAERLRPVRVFIERVLELMNPPSYMAGAEYELRDADGGLIDPGIQVKDAAAIRARATLYLNPRAGVGA